MLAIGSFIAFLIAVILVALDKTGSHLENPLLWIGVGGCFLALHEAGVGPAWSWNRAPRA
jgi:hypothetical protein